MLKRKTRIVNPLLGNSYDEVFELINSGKATADQFDEWIDEVRSNAYGIGYDHGWFAAQEESEDA